MNLKVYLTIFLAVSLATQAIAQTKPAAMTNASVIKLIKAGLDADIVQSKIASSSCKFDLSDDGLIALKTAGVSSEVIKTMMNRMSPPAASSPASAANFTAASPVAAPAATSNIPDPEMINAVYLYDKAARSIKGLEKHSASMKTQMKMLGYGGTDFVFEVPGAHSTVRFTPEQVQSFLVNIGSGPADIFVLYKVEVKKNVRQAIGGRFQLTGIKGSKGVIATDIKLAKPGIYELIPSVKLEKGEYFFALKGAATATTSNTDVYAFGID